MKELLKNREGRYPWEEVRPVFGLLYFAGLPAAALAEEGLEMAIAGFVVGVVLFSAFALMWWRWPP